MYQKILCFAILFLMLGILNGMPARAGTPTDQIRETTDKILAIVTDTALKAPQKAEERRKLIRACLDERFDWMELARRSLALHWAQRTEEEKENFVSLYKMLLERTYLNKVEGYSGEKVTYVGESVDGDYSTVTVKIITTKDQEITVEYRLRNKQDNWLIYDISIESVSLVNNYRAQFSTIINESSYEELLKRMTKKVSQE